MFEFCSAPKRDVQPITTQWKRHNLKMETKKRMKGSSDEIKTPEQIVRERLRMDLIKNREKINKKTKDSNRKRSAKQQRRNQKQK